MKIRIELNWHDKWFGVYDEIKIRKTIPKYDFMPAIENEQHIWICIIPCLPIHIWWEIKNEG